MTAAERATAMATQGAAEHRAETMWHRPSHDTAPSALEPLRDEPTEYCRSSPPDFGLYVCTREAGHPGRHVATNHERMYAAWPGTHEPTLADLDDPQPAAEQPPTLTLPDGWESFTRQDGSIGYCRHERDDLVDELYADAHTVDYDRKALTTERARALAARLIEAAWVVEQLRAGVR